MAVDEQRIESYMQAAKALQDGKVLRTAFARGAAHDQLDPGKEHRLALDKKAHDYAVKSGSEEGAVAGLRMKQVNASGTSAGGGKSKKDRQSRKAIIDEMLRQLADINRQIQWYQDEIQLLEQDLSRVEDDVEQANERLSEIIAVADLRDQGAFDPENNPDHAARLNALGISVEAYIANPGILDRAAQDESARIGRLEAQSQDLRAKIRDYGVRIDELEDERDEVARSLDALGEDPSLEQIKDVTAGKSTSAVGEVAHDTETSQETAKKVYEAIGLEGENLDDLADLRSGERLAEDDAALGDEADHETETPPFAADDVAEARRTTSSAKEIARPPFMSDSLSEAFEKAHNGFSEDSQPALEERASIDLRSAPGFASG